MYLETTFAVLCPELETSLQYDLFKPTRKTSETIWGKQAYTKDDTKAFVADQLDSVLPDQPLEPIQGSAASDLGSSAKGRKRKRKAYNPNEREQQAELRHSKIEPGLKSALQGFAAWFQTFEGLTVQEALLQCGSNSCQLGSQTPSEATKEGCRSDKADVVFYDGALGGRSNSTVLTDAIISANGGQREMQRTNEDCKGSPNEKAARDEGQDLDFLALADLQSLVKPKFTFHGEADRPFNLFNCHISNTALDEREADAHESSVIIPGSCSFFLADMSKFKMLLKEPGMAGSFDCIVMDPPWENKSVKRANKYPTVPSRQLLSLPIPQLLKKDGGLLVLWMTNREKHHRFVEDELLPAWKLRRLAQWFWLKIDPSGNLVGPLEVAHRRPYETILLAAPAGFEARVSLPDNFCIFSVPGEHSRKPHLSRLLQKYLSDEPKCIEVFARELARGWTSIGNQVLHFQQKKYFSKAAIAS